MQTVTSADGTEIAYEQFGEGSPLVLAHPSAVDRTVWFPARERLAAEFTVTVYDRRGRGESGDAGEYALEREVEDLLAVIDAVDDSVSLYGHSFGALCALEAARRSATVSRLVLYEPPIVAADANDLSGRLWDLVEAGEGGRAKRVFFAEAADLDGEGAGPDEVPPAVEETPARTIAREAGVVEEYELPKTAAVSVPTLVFRGEESPDHLYATAADVAEAVPGADLVELPGVGHGAQASPPVIDRVIEFCRD